MLNLKARFTEEEEMRHVVNNFHEKVRIWAPLVSQQIPLKSIVEEELARCMFCGEMLTYHRSDVQT